MIEFPVPRMRVTISNNSVIQLEPLLATTTIQQIAEIDITRNEKSCQNNSSVGHCSNILVFFSNISLQSIPFHHLSAFVKSTSRIELNTQLSYSCR